MVDELLDEPEAMREIHAIRVKLHEETKHMTPREKTDFFNREAAEMAEKCGLKRAAGKPIPALVE